MNLFNYFRKNNQEVKTSQTVTDNLVPKELFIDENDPVQVEIPKSPETVRGIESIYSFLQADYETRGYNDALTNPDISYKNDNIKLMKQDLLIHIQRAITYYEAIMKELDFHISTRSRSGLIDIVEQLKMRREMVVNYIEKIQIIQADTKNETGLSERVILSYQRGFTRGLAAITINDVFNRNL